MKLIDAVVNIRWKAVHSDERGRPDDFIAIACDMAIGRVYRVYGGPRHGDWYFNFQLGHSPFRTSAMNGVVAKRKVAEQEVIQAFVAYLATPSDLGGGKPGGRFL